MNIKEIYAVKFVQEAAWLNRIFCTMEQAEGSEHCKLSYGRKLHITYRMLQAMEYRPELCNALVLKLSGSHITIYTNDSQLVRVESFAIGTKAGSWPGAVTAYLDRVVHFLQTKQFPIN